jgi:hypothetical protein
LISGNCKTLGIALSNGTFKRIDCFYWILVGSSESATAKLLQSRKPLIIIPCPANSPRDTDGIYRYHHDKPSVGRKTEDDKSGTSRNKCVNHEFFQVFLC